MRRAASCSRSAASSRRPATPTSCPTGVATQDPLRQRALVVADKAERVANFHRNTLARASDMIAAAGPRASCAVRPTILSGASATPNPVVLPAARLPRAGRARRGKRNAHSTAMPGTSPARTVSNCLGCRRRPLRAHGTASLGPPDGHCRYQAAAQRERVRAFRLSGRAHALVGARDANDICIFSR